MMKPGGGGGAAATASSALKVLYPESNASSQVGVGPDAGAAVCSPGSNGFDGSNGGFAATVSMDPVLAARLGIRSSNIPVLRPRVALASPPCAGLSNWSNGFVVCAAAKRESLTAEYT